MEPGGGGLAALLRNNKALQHSGRVPVLHGDIPGSVGWIQPVFFNPSQFPSFLKPPVHMTLIHAGPMITKTALSGGQRGTILPFLPTEKPGGSSPPVK